MPVYEYSAINQKGKNTTGVIDADNPVVARQKLRSSNIFPVSVREVHETAALKKMSRRWVPTKLINRIRPSEVAVMTRQLATLVGAGFPLVTADCRDGEIILTQQRFTYLSGEFDQQWLIPIKLEFFSGSGDSQVQTLLMDTRQTRVAVPADTAAYKLNAGQTGFFRVRYEDSENLQQLGRMVADRALASWGSSRVGFSLTARS